MFRNRHKLLEIIAGPNGSGKSSFASTLFGGNGWQINFINADIVATGLAPGREELASFRAGRVVLSSVIDAIEKRESVAFESTLSGKTWEGVIRRARANGFHVTIYFLFLENIAMNLKRIEKRVRAGGHSIPPPTVRRRYPRSFFNFWKIYRAHCDDWFIFDNSSTRPVLVLGKRGWEELSSVEKGSFELSFLARALHNGKAKTR